MASQSKGKYRSYMKPVAKRVTIQKPVWKLKVVPHDVQPDGFVRLSDSRIRKIYL